MKPVTELPWRDGPGAFSTEKDRAYIVHACNNYPAMVEALTNILQFAVKANADGAFKDCVLPLAAGYAIDAARLALTAAGEVRP